MKRTTGGSTVDYTQWSGNSCFTVLSVTSPPYYQCTNTSPTHFLTGQAVTKWHLYLKDHLNRKCVNTYISSPWCSRVDPVWRAAHSLVQSMSTSMSTLIRRWPRQTGCAQLAGSWPGRCSGRRRHVVTGYSANCLVY
jgi:hypothetical protein